MTDFPLPPENMLSEQVSLPQHRLALGLMHPEGEAHPIVFVWDGELLRRVSHEAALNWANDIETGPYAEALKPVADGLRGLVGKAEVAATNALFKRAGRAVYGKFIEMPVEGNA